MEVRFYGVCVTTFFTDRLRALLSYINRIMMINRNLFPHASLSLSFEAGHVLGYNTALRRPFLCASGGARININIIIVRDYCSISKSDRIGAMSRQRSLLMKILIMSIELLIIFMLASNHILIPKACSFNYFPDSPLPSKKSFREELSLQSAPSIHWDEATQFSAFKPFLPDNSQPQRKNALPKVCLNFRVPKNEEFRLIPLTYFSVRREGYQQETRHLCDPLFEYFDPNEAPLYRNSKENLSETQAEDCSLEDSDRIGIKQKIGAQLTPHCQIQQKKSVNNDPFIIIKQRRPNLPKKSKPIQKEPKRANLNFPCSLNSKKRLLLTKQLSTHSGDQPRDEPEFSSRRSKSQILQFIGTAMGEAMEEGMEEGMGMNFLIDSEENDV